MRQLPPKHTVKLLKPDLVLQLVGHVRHEHFLEVLLSLLLRAVADGEDVCMLHDVHLTEPMPVRNGVEYRRVKGTAKVAMEGGEGKERDKERDQEREGKRMRGQSRPAEKD